MPVSEHLVQFYDAEHELVDAVVPFLADGLEARESVLAIASEPHRRAFERELELMDVGFADAMDSGSYVSIDAAEILRYLRDGESGPPDETGFDETIGALVQRHLASGRELRAYSEIVGLLLDEGDASNAVVLREMWNRLQEQEEFRLFCAYHTPHPAQFDELRQVWRPDSHRLPTITEDEPLIDALPVGAWFAPSLKAAGRVRRLLRVALVELGMNDELIERATLVASELAANAVVHAHSPFRLFMQPLSDSLWLGVKDRAPLGNRHALVGRPPHGLGLVAALALRWGVGLNDTGKVVWAEIPSDSGAA